MCGIIALLLGELGVHQAAGPELYEGLGLLQHRGQDACGIVTCGPKGRFYQMKGNGMVRDVFDPSAIGSLIGSMGIGHARYPTAGTSLASEAQPFYVNSPYGIVLSHNGNLINTPHLRYYLDHYAHRHINTDSDSELLLNILADNLQKTGKFRIDQDDIFRAVGELLRHCHGAYACTAMLAGFGIMAFRDPNGIRPLGYGRRRSSNGKDWDYAIASESVVIDALGFSDWTDVQPGECIIITTKGAISKRQVVPKRTFAPDIFEYVYFARPDSVMDGISVYSARMAMGEALAAEIQRRVKLANLEVDVVIPVPDTSRVAALQAAQTMGVPYREGFCKNRYVGRTFIMPGQSMRRKNVRRKLNAMTQEFAGKTVLLVDDSIVRGTTSKEIIQMARDAGAKKVIMASCAPPIRYPNVYGIDMPSRQELVAYDRTEEEIAAYIGADLIVFQTLDALIESCRQFNPAIETFDCSVFTGEYITGGVDEEYLNHIHSLREDSAKAKKKSQSGGKATAPEHGAEGWRSQTPLAGEKGARQPNGHATGADEVEEDQSCSGPMNGADAIGLYNEPLLSRRHSPSRASGGQVGLSNSFYAGISEMDINETAETVAASEDLGVSEGANAVAGGAGASANAGAAR